MLLHSGSSKPGEAIRWSHIAHGTYAYLAAAYATTMRQYRHRWGQRAQQQINNNSAISRR